MADEADLAQIQAAPLNTTDHRKKEGPTALGWCLNCGPEVELPKGHRWCDHDCYTDWDKRNNRGKR